MRSTPKQPGRSEKQRGEEPVQEQDLAHGANGAVVLPSGEENGTGTLDSATRVRPRGKAFGTRKKA